MDKTVKVREQDNCCNGNRVEGGEGGAYENVHEFWRRAVQVLVFFFYNYKCPPEKGLEEKKKRKEREKNGRAVHARAVRFACASLLLLDLGPGLFQFLESGHQSGIGREKKGCAHSFSPIAC